MTPAKKNTRNPSFDDFTKRLLKSLTVKKSEAFLVINSKNKIVYCTESVAKIFNKKKKLLLNSKFTYQSNGLLKTTSKSKKEIIYNVHSTAITLKKEKLKFLFFTKLEHKPAKVLTTKSKEEFINSSKMFQLVLDNIQQRVFWKDRNFRYLGCNKAFAADAHLDDPSKILGKNDFELSWKETAESYRKDDEEVMESGIPKINYEESQSSPDGKTLWLRTSKIPLLDDNQNVIGILGTYEDITEHKKIEDALLANKRLLNTIISNFPDQLYVKDLESRFLLCSKAVVENAEKINPNIKKEEDLVGKNDFDVFPNTEAGKYRNQEKEIMKTGQSIFNLEESFGGKISLITKVPMKDEFGKIVGLIGVNRDITERKETEEKLKNERILLRTIIDNLPDAIYTKDINRRKTLVNKADLANLGCKDESEALGKTDFDFFAEEAASEFYLDDQKVLNEGKIVMNRDESFVDKDGNVRWLLTSKLPLRAADGNIIGLVGIGHDITQRKKSELISQALFEISEATYTASDMDTLYKSIHDVIKTLMPANNFYIALNDESTGLLSFPYFVDEHNSPLASKRLEKALTEYILSSEEAVLVDTDKYKELTKICEVELESPPAAILLGVPLKIGGKVTGVLVVRDYSNERAYKNDEMQLLIFVSNQIAQVIERKKNSEAIKKYIDELKLLNMTKDKFFSIIAHDLKNPFITILGFCDLLLSDYSELTEEEKLFYMTEMKKSADLNYNLLQNLLQWSRSQTGKIEFIPKKVQLLDIVNENFLLLKKAAENKQIQLQYEVPTNLHVNADENMLNTIIRNLLTNAVKFSRKGGNISVNAVTEKNYVEVCVADFGVGMDQKTIDNLFKLDVAHSTCGTDNELGTGLGLILCKEFVEKNGGKIWVESKVGKGSKFYFTLPYLI